MTGSRSIYLGETRQARSGCRARAARRDLYAANPTPGSLLHTFIAVTERQGHAGDIVETMSLDFDAVVTVSGDGLLHEVLNGFAKRPDARKAMQIPVAPIPTGSGNGFSLSLLGLKVRCARCAVKPIDQFAGRLRPCRCSVERDQRCVSVVRRPRPYLTLQ